MDRSALVTGGSRRIGKAISVGLAEIGYDIALHYRHSAHEARETAREVEAMGRKCLLFQCNLEVIKEVRNLVPEVFKSFPNCSILVNNASIFENISFLDVKEVDFNRNFNINFKSPFFISQDFSKQPQASLIINLLDSRVTKLEVDHFVYNITKKALRDFTQMAAKALGPKIRVNGICPGPILPPPGKDDSYLQQKIEQLPLKMCGDLYHITSAVKYLVKNPFITGECLFVDGGEHLT